jgi:hypothetical protein
MVAKVAEVTKPRSLLKFLVIEREKASMTMAATTDKMNTPTSAY